MFSKSPIKIRNDCLYYLLIIFIVFYSSQPKPDDQIIDSNLGPSEIPDSGMKVKVEPVDVPTSVNVVPKQENPSEAPKTVPGGRTIGEEILPQQQQNALLKQLLQGIGANSSSATSSSSAGALSNAVTSVVSTSASSSLANTHPMTSVHLTTRPTSLMGLLAKVCIIFSPYP